MKITCISASNVEMAKDNSASTRTCEIVRDLLEEAGVEADVEIVRLVDRDLRPCTMCGGCLEAGNCVHDDDFSAIYAGLRASDALFVVVPHYAPIPSKMMIVLEKLEEMAFLNWTANPEGTFTLHGKPAGVIAHGGMPDEEKVTEYYKKALVEPISNALASVQMKVVGAGEAWPRGVSFGIVEIKPRPGSIFVDIEHDWDLIRERVAPLVRNVTAELQGEKEDAA